jgi:hypothetical protein
MMSPMDLPEQEDRGLSGADRQRRRPPIAHLSLTAGTALLPASSKKKAG